MMPAPAAFPRPGPATLYLHKFLPWLVALLVLLGLAGRLRQYTALASYWYDEAYLLLNIFDKDCRELLGPLQHDQAGPPVYFWTLRGLYCLAGSAEWVMRLPAFVASVLALFVMVPASRRLVGGSGWLWAVGLCALCKQAADRGAEVKPYSWDFLATLLILLAAHRCLMLTGERPRGRTYGWLFALAVVAPWCSLPSVFVLAGVSLALLFAAFRSGQRLPWWAWLVFNLLCLVSAASLYVLVLRHQRTATLEAYWQNAFGTTSSLLGLLRWLPLCLVKIGQYGSNGLGIPLVLFAAAGGVRLGRRSPAHLLLLAGPLAVSLTASVLHLYPLEDRLTFYLLPCLYLLAAEGLGACAEAVCTPSCPRWLTGPCLTGLTCLLLAGTGPALQMAVCAPEPGFREALAYARRHGAADDLYWVSHPQVFAVYFCRSAPCLGSYDASEHVLTQACRHRLWFISTHPCPCRLEEQLRARGFVVLDSYQTRSHCARLYALPAPGVG